MGDHVLATRDEFVLSREKKKLAKKFKHFGKRLNARHPTMRGLFADLACIILI